MIPAPLVAIADTNPRSIRSMRTGDSPVLRTWAPSPQTIARSSRRARTTAATTCLKSAPASSAGKFSTKLVTPVPGLWGLANCATDTLLWRDASGYVRTPDRSNTSYGSLIAIRYSLFARPVPVRVLNDQHRVTVTIEPIAIGDSLTIRLEHELG